MMLKYLFTATFDDGSFIQQTPDDVSRNDPLRSQFTDVLDVIRSGRKLVRFELEEVGTMNSHAVDLTDGHFETNGVSFRLHDDPMFKDFKIIFYRQHQHEIQVSQKENKELSHRVRYVIGWEVAAKAKCPCCKFVHTEPGKLNPSTYSRTILID